MNRIKKKICRLKMCPCAIEPRQAAWYHLSPIFTVFVVADGFSWKSKIDGDVVAR